MTRPHQHDLDEDVRHAHDQTSTAAIVRRTVRGVDAAASAVPDPETRPDETTGRSPFHPAVIGGLNAINGTLSAREGIAAMRAAAERERDARAHHDGQGIQNAREDEANAAFATARGTTTAGQGGSQLAQAALRPAATAAATQAQTSNAVAAQVVNSTEQAGLARTAADDALASTRAAGRVTRVGNLARNLGRGAGVLQMGQGVFNLGNAVRNWNRPGMGNRAAQEASDGILNTTAGALALSSNPLATAASSGIALGTIAREGADSYAQQSGVLGHSHTSQRGFRPGHSGGAQNLSATDAAVEAGMDVRARLGNGVVGSVAGGLTTLATAPLIVGATLAHRGISAALPTGQPDGIIAADQEERHAPLAANDHSQIAEHRRNIQRRHAREAAAQEAATHQHHAQVAAEGHPEMMQPETAPANATFTAINGADAQSIERRALGMPAAFDREAFERAVVENSR